VDASLDGLGLLEVVALNLTFVATSWLAARQLRLHDVMRSYLQTELAQHLDPKLVHGKLLDVWGHPNKLPDAYAWQWYTYHIAAGRVAELRGSLLNPAWLRAKLAATDVTALSTDFDRLPEDEDLDLVHSALRLSAHVIGKDPKQFSSQMVGRLLIYRDMPAIARFADRVAKGTGVPWLRPLHVALYPSGSALVRTLEGHTAAVLGVALSGDGRRAVSASRDKTLKVWEVESGRELRTLEGHTAAVLGVALSGDGQRAVSASRDKTLKVWEVGSGRELRTLEGHTDIVWGVALSGDGRRAVSASSDKTLKVWEVESGVPLATLNCDSAAYCCAFSEALKLVCGGDALGRVHFLELVEPKVNG
jgi:WD40 repeat protein